MPRPTVTTNCVADHYADKHNERIIEVRDPETGRGCLIAIRRKPNDDLSICVYRADEGVSVSIEHAGGTAVRDARPAQPNPRNAVGGQDARAAKRLSADLGL